MVEAAILALAALGLLGLEAVGSARRWPRVAGWWGRAALLLSVHAAVVVAAGLALEPWLARRRPWSGEALGPAGGWVVGLLALTFAHYWWHRARHASPLLWRHLHQVHHSPQRVIVASAHYAHPLEAVSNAVLSAAMLYLAVGLAPREAGVVAATSGLLALVQHTNVATPRWLGWLIQRPESHCLHHDRVRRGFNFGELPLWDAIFGTLCNPERWDGRCGLPGDGERRLGALLVGQEMHEADAHP